jgi:hypothetical protein
MIWTICLTAGTTHSEAGRGWGQGGKLRVALLPVLTPEYPVVARLHAVCVFMQCEQRAQTWLACRQLSCMWLD